MTTHSEELFARLPSGVELCYQTFGEETGKPLVLVMGLGCPMTWWDTGLIDLLVEQGFFVIRFDNREIGRSSAVAGTVPTGVDLLRAWSGLPITPAYTLRDMAQDVFELLDHLHIPAAHVAGASMGGMIVQEMALMAPERVLSMTSISSSPRGRLHLGLDPRFLPDLLARPARTEQEYIDASLRFWFKVASPAYPYDWQAARDLAAATWTRGINGTGSVRQSIAILIQGNRTKRLASLRTPTLVIHGLADRLIHPSGGRATARAVPGASLLLVPGMGHDLPPALFPLYSRSIARVASRATVQEHHP